MQRSPAVSFVVPCYNYGKYLPECLRGIFNQEGWQDFEVIAIDDCSTDNTPQILSQNSDPRLKVIRHKTNLGHIASINEGFREARGEFVVRFDPDDRPRPYFLQSVLEKLYAFPEVGLVYGDIALINEAGQITCKSCDNVHRGKDFKGNEFLKLLEHNFIAASTVIMRRKALQGILPIPEETTLLDDWYLSLMLARRYEFYYVNRALVEYRVHPANFHVRCIREKRSEPSTFWLLDYIFLTPEISRRLEKEKQKKKRRIYAGQSFLLANQYFGMRMGKDARRLYLKTIRFEPLYILRPCFLRRLLATLIGFRLYERVISVFKKA